MKKSISFLTVPTESKQLICPHCGVLASLFSTNLLRLMPGAEMPTTRDFKLEIYSVTPLKPPLPPPPPPPSSIHQPRRENSSWLNIYSIQPSIPPSVRPTVCPSVCPSVHPSIHFVISKIFPFVSVNFCNRLRELCTKLQSATRT